MSITDAGYGGPFAIRWLWIAGSYTERSATMHVPYTVLFDFAALRLSTVVISLEPNATETSARPYVSSDRQLSVGLTTTANPPTKIHPKKPQLLSYAQHLPSHCTRESRAVRTYSSNCLCN